MRKINLMNEASRNAEVALESVRTPKGISTGLPGGKKVSFKRYVAATETTLHSKLTALHGDALARALIAGDPEIDRELVGRDVGETQTVFLSGTGEVLHASPSLVEVIFGTDGKERERKPAESVPANTNEESPVRFTKLRMKRGELVTKFAVARTIQIKHTERPQLRLPVRDGQGAGGQGRGGSPRRGAEGPRPADLPGERGALPGLPRGPDRRAALQAAAPPQQPRAARSGGCCQLGAR
jgi:hypothetical protein